MIVPDSLLSYSPSTPICVCIFRALTKAELLWEKYRKAASLAMISRRWIEGRYIMRHENGWRARARDIVRGRADETMRKWRRKRGVSNWRMSGFFNSLKNLASAAAYAGSSASRYQELEGEWIFYESIRSFVFSFLSLLLLLLVFSVSSWRLADDDIYIYIKIRTNFYQKPFSIKIKKKTKWSRNVKSWSRTRNVTERVSRKSVIFNHGLICGSVTAGGQR